MPLWHLLRPGRSITHAVLSWQSAVGYFCSQTYPRREIYQRAIDAMAARGAQAVILGCTEITLLIKQEDTSLPVFDTTALHAQRAVDWAIQTR